MADIVTIAIGRVVQIHMVIPNRKIQDMMSSVSEADPKQKQTAGTWFARFARPGLGIVIPVSLAAVWEVIVWLGYSDGRLMPPPSLVYQELVDLAQTGELQLHSTVTLLRVAAGFA